MRALSLAAILVLTVAAAPLAVQIAVGAGQRAGWHRADLLQTSDNLPSSTFPIPPGIGSFGPQGPHGSGAQSFAAPGSGAHPADPKVGGAPAAPAPSPPQTRAQILDELFTRLSHSSDSDESKGIAGAIERVWMHSGSDTADLLMHRAVSALGGEDYVLAQRVLDAIVVIDPDWSEGWNKRATTRFFAEDYTGAMEDISRVLAIEPRHFGALSGMGFILQRTGFDKEALRVFRKTLEIYPQQESIRKIVDDLTIKVEGRGI